MALNRGPLPVSFPQRPGSPADLGDLAVLELAEEVTNAPASLAPATTAHGDRKLVAYGFPAGWDEGTLAEYAPPSRSWSPTSGSSWRRGADTASRPAGFSGAAVSVVETGEVVGMVTAAAGAKGLLSGRMMPTDVIERHWPALAGLTASPRPSKPCTPGCASGRCRGCP